MLTRLFNIYKKYLFLPGVILTGVITAALLNNIVVSPAPAKSEIQNKIITVAAIGDSNTQGAGVANQEKDSYPAQLQKLLGEKYRVLNYGVGGTTALSNLSNAYSKTKFYQQSQTVSPDIVLIMLGTNDSTKERWNATLYEQDLLDLVHTYKHLSNSPRVYLLTPPFAYIPGNTAQFGQINGETITNEVVPIVKRTGKRTNVSVIDIYAATKNQSSLFPDRVHANAIGYGIIANEIYQVIKRPNYL